jgi:signal transduction histidine kinase
MSIKPLIFLFFAWLIWGGFVAQNVLSQNQKNQTQMADMQFKSEGQMLDWFFQERTLQLRSMQDDEPVLSRYSLDEWKSLQPWKGVVFLKNNDAHMYGVFDKVMPEAHRKQLIEKIKQLKPTARFEGVHWESFQWNGTPFVLGYLPRSYGLQAFIAQGDDWGRTLSIIPSENSWVIANQAGRILFHPDVRYVGQKKPVMTGDNERERDLASTNLVAYLDINKAASSKSLYAQLALITLGLALITSVLINQLMKKERSQNEKRMEVFRARVIEEAEERARALPAVQEVPTISQEHMLKDLSHRVSSSLGRQLEPALINILGQAQWMLSLGLGHPEKRSPEENSALETIIREVRSSKSMLEKLLAVAGERKIDLFPMKIETPVLRVLKRWQVELEHQHVLVEKDINDTSFFPINSEALEKALSHLIQNSLEAMSRKLDKSIKIELKDEGDDILLVFEDNGGGIEPHHLNLIGDAFFTTKSQTRHLGLGLTEAFGIFKQHHAIVTVTSEVGKFTRFEICFDKDEAQKLIQKQEVSRTRVFEESLITVPENIPQPTEMTRALYFVDKQDELKQAELEAEQTQQKTVDEEIEKLLELGEMDFIEPVTDMEAAETPAEDASLFLDINPDLADESTAEIDDFQMKDVRSRRDLDV